MPHSIGPRTASIIRERIRRYLASCAEYPDLLPPGETDSLLESGILDSVSLLQLIGFLEQEFGIAVDDADILPSNFLHLVALEEFVLAKLARLGRHTDAFV